MKLAHKLYNIIQERLGMSVDSTVCPTTTKIFSSLPSLKSSELDIECLDSTETVANDKISRAELKRQSSPEELKEMFSTRQEAIVKRQMNSTQTEDITVHVDSLDIERLQASYNSLLKRGEKVDITEFTDEGDCSNDSVEETRFTLRSAYFSKHNHEPDVTNWSGDFRGTLDYIFISPSIHTVDIACYPEVEPLASKYSYSNEASALQLNSESIDCSKLRIHDCQPSEHWPSDHMLLKATLAIRFQEENA